MTSDSHGPVLTFKLGLPSHAHFLGSDAAWLSRLTQKLDHIAQQLGIQAEVLISAELIENDYPTLAINTIPAFFDKAAMLTHYRQAVGQQTAIQDPSALPHAGPEVIAAAYAGLVEAVCLDNLHLLLTDEVFATFSSAVNLPLNDQLRGFLQRALAYLFGFGFGFGRIVHYRAAIFEFQASKSPTYWHLLESLFTKLNKQRIDIHLSTLTLRGLTESSDLTQNDLKSERDNIFYRTGLILPDVKFVIDETMPEHAFAFEVQDVLHQTIIGLAPNERLEERPPAAGEFGIYHPLEGHLCTLCSAEGSQKSTITPFQHLVLHLSRLMRDRGETFVDRSFVENQIAKLAESHPTLVDAVRQYVSLDQFAHAMRLLVQEGVSVRNFPILLEAAIDFEIVIINDDNAIVFDDRLALESAAHDNVRHEPILLNARLRNRVKDAITAKALTSNGSISVFIIQDEMNLAIKYRGDVSFNAHCFGVDVILGDRLRRVVAEAKVGYANKLPLTILATDLVRPVLRYMLKRAHPDVVVLAYSDLNSNANIIPIEQLSLA